MYADLVMPVFQLLEREGIVEVLGILRVDRECRDFPEISPLLDLLCRDDIFYLFGSSFHARGELHGQLVFRHDGVHFRVVVSRRSENFQHFPHRVLLVLRPLGNLDDGFFPVLGTVQVCQGDKYIVR